MSPRDGDSAGVGAALGTGAAESGSVPRGSRAVSTVLDVALFLLLVSAAVGVLYAVPDPSADGPQDADDAAAVATTLSASTTTVRYAPDLEGSSATARTDRGSVAQLLAAATVANATVADRPVVRDEQYVDAVGTETRATLAAVGGASEVQVRARWEPLPGADVLGETVVGPTPPPEADVHAATVSVPLGTASDRGVAALGREDADGHERGGSDHSANATRRHRSLVDVAQTAGCDGLSTAIARRVVGHVFPPEPIRAALGGDAESRRAIATRYETFADAVGVDSGTVSLEDGPRVANAVLVEALAAAFEPVACRGYADPATAAREAAPKEVTLVVRAWSG